MQKRATLLDFHLRWKRREGGEKISPLMFVTGVAPTVFTGVVWTKIIHCIVPHQIHGVQESEAKWHEENTTIGFVDGIHGS